MTDIVYAIRSRTLPTGGTFELMDDAADEIERLRSICQTISTGLRGQYASRLDMALLAESAVIGTAAKRRRRR